MRITILAMGSRGDVQPYLALGSGLQAVGHQVCVATAPNFEAFVRERGLDFAPMGGDFRELMDSEATRRLLEKSNLLNYLGDLNKGNSAKLATNCWVLEAPATVVPTA